jgi:hypothetical protein
MDTKTDDVAQPIPLKIVGIRNFSSTAANKRHRAQADTRGSKYSCSF